MTDFATLVQAAESPDASPAPASASPFAAMVNAADSTQTPVAPTATPGMGAQVANALGSSALGAGELGAAKGIADTAIIGPAQLIAHGINAIYPASWPGSGAVQGMQTTWDNLVNNENQTYTNATAQHPVAANTGNIVGDVASAMVPTGEAAEGASLARNAVQGIKNGALFGAAQPADPQNYWTQKALQTGAGGVGGGIGSPLAAIAGRAANALGMGVEKLPVPDSAEKVVTEALNSNSP